MRRLLFPFELHSRAQESNYCAIGDSPPDVGGFAGGRRPYQGPSPFSFFSVRQGVALPHIRRHSRAGDVTLYAGDTRGLAPFLFIFRQGIVAASPPDVRRGYAAPVTLT